MKNIVLILPLLLGLGLGSAQAQTTATYGEKQIGLSCADGMSSPDFDTVTQCNSLLAATGTFQKAPLYAGALTASAYGTTTCDANKAGILQWTGTELQYCNGSAWTTVGGGGGGSPSGQIKIWPTSTVPTGYLACDGTAVSRTTYADLFAVISTRYGVGDGSTTFNLPNYQGEFLRGWSNSTGNDPDAASRTNSGDGVTTGDNVGTKQASAQYGHNHAAGSQSASLAGVGNHSHTPSGAGSVAGSGLGGSGSRGDHSGTVAGDGNHTDHSFNVSAYTMSAQTDGNAYETRPRNVYMMYIIKY